MRQACSLAFAALFWIVLQLADAIASGRIALVIGNSAYRNAAPLKNPVNDAKGIAAKLEELEFEVITGYDLDQAGLHNSVRTVKS